MTKTTSHLAAIAAAVLLTVVTIQQAVTVPAYPAMIVLA